MRQVVIAVPNRPGVIAEISSQLAAAGISIRNMQAGSVGAVGTITLQVDRHEDAVRILREAGFPVVGEDALIIRLRDEPGAIARIAGRFIGRQINIHSLHFVDRHNGDALIALVCEPREAARELLQDVLVENGKPPA